MAKGRSSDLSDRQLSGNRNKSALHSCMRAWAGFALLALPTMLLGMDLTLLHLLMPAIALDLQPSTTQALWILDAYGFLIAGFLLTMGWLGDRVGRRRLLMFGLTGFALASIAAAFAISAGMLIAARAALGIAGATLMPSTLALISNLFQEQRQRALAIGMWATMWGIGYALGPLVGGLLLEKFWWGAAFLIAVPVTLLVLLLAPFVLPEYRALNGGACLDVGSVVLSFFAMLPFVYGVKTASESGFSMVALVAMAFGLIAAWLFIRRQARVQNPLIDLAMFRNRAFRAALLILLLTLVAVGGTMFMVAQYLQLVKGHSPVAAGLWMSLAAVAMIAGGIGAPLLARIFRPGSVVAGSLALAAVGYVMLMRVGQADSGLLPVLTSLALAYLCNGTVAALGTDLVVGASPPEKAGSASALTEVVQDLGLSLGVALLGSLASVAYATGVGSYAHLNLDGVRDSLGESLWAASSATSDLSPEVLSQLQQAFMTGLQWVGTVNALCAAVLSVLAALALTRS